jgi:hypothetical protein
MGRYQVTGVCKIPGTAEGFYLFLRGRMYNFSA